MAVSSATSTVAIQAPRSRVIAAIVLRWAGVPPVDQHQGACPRTLPNAPCADGVSFLDGVGIHERNEEDEVTKSELVDQVADRAELTKQDAARAVEAVLATVEDALRRGSEVTVSGFGKFHVSERGARMGVNPRTGERIQIAASRVPRFTAGSGLKSAVKGR